MSDPHTLRHPLPAMIHHFLDRLPGLHREEPTPPVNGTRNPTHPLSPQPLTPHQHDVLQTVAEQRIHRDILLGTLEPHLLDGKDATRTPHALVVRGLVCDYLAPVPPVRSWICGFASWTVSRTVYRRL